MGDRSLYARPRQGNVCVNLALTAWGTEISGRDCRLKLHFEVHVRLVISWGRSDRKTIERWRT